MTACDRCKKESGNLLCGKCRDKLMHRRNLIPILFWDRKLKGYRAGCTVHGCPNNENGVCMSVFSILRSMTFHEFDGDNCVKVVCG